MTRMDFIKKYDGTKLCAVYGDKRFKDISDKLLKLGYTYHFGVYTAVFIFINNFDINTTANLEIFDTSELVEVNLEDMIKDLNRIEDEFVNGARCMKKISEASLIYALSTVPEKLRDMIMKKFIMEQDVKYNKIIKNIYNYK